MYGDACAYACASIEILSPGADIGAAKGRLSPNPSQEGCHELTDLFRTTYLVPVIADNYSYSRYRY